MFEKYSLTLKQLGCPDQFSKVISQNLVLTLCNYGEGRSPEAAWKLTEQFGINSVYLECGIGGLSIINYRTQIEYISRLKQFKQIYIFLYTLERQKLRQVVDMFKLPEDNFYPKVEPFIDQIRIRPIALS